MDKKPTAEGRERYPALHNEAGFYIADSGEHIPCTCSERCSEECEGECGCEACQRCALDIAHGE